MKNTRPPAEPTWHSLRVRTAAGVEWEVACQFILRLELALKAARALREFLAGDPAAQVGAPPWATDIRDAVAEDGADPRACTVVVCRGRPPRWRTVAVLPVTPKPKPAFRRARRVGRNRRRAA